MVQKVFILGDSFGDANWPDDHDLEFVWPHKLTEKYDVINLARIGTGPEYSINKLFTILENWPEDLSESYLIFIHSDVNRLNLSCYKDAREQSHVYAITEGTMKHRAHVFLKQAFKWYMDHDWVQQQYVKNFCTIKHCSQYFKSVLFWPLNSFEYPNDTLKDLLLKDQTMHTVDIGLFDISAVDCGEVIHHLYQDSRPNHLQELNHITMYGELVNWIENNQPIDTSKFKYVGPLETK